MLVDLFFPGLAARRALLGRSICLGASAHDDFGAAELGLLKQRFEPGFKLIVEVVHEDDLGFGDILAVR